jgi:hypothetical protein
MNYHLHRQGQDPIVLSLDELRRRREAGELTGAELVWQEGMPQWQSLDTVLAPRPSFAAPGGSDRTGSRARGRIILFAVLVVMLGGAGALSWWAVLMLKREPEPNRSTVRRPAPTYKPAVEILAPLPTNTLTYRDVRKKERDFRVRQWVDGYKERGARSHPLDADALRAMEGWMANHYGEPGQSNTPVSAIFDKLAAAQDFNDPLVLTLSVDETTPDQVVPRLERALAAYPGSKHRAYPRFALAVRLIEKTREAERLEALFATAREAFAETFRDGSVVPEDQAILAEILVHGWGYNHFLYRTPDAARTVTRQLGPEWRWLHWVVSGEAERAQGWRDRGGGYANTVSERGWELFQAHMIRAQTNFSAAWQLRPDLALAPAQMIDVAMSMADDAEMRRWFRRAVAAQIDYHAAWTAMRWGLRPRWHGNLEKMLEFGLYAVDTGRFDTDVPRKLFDSITDIESEMEVPFGVHLYQDRRYWRPLQRMYEGYLAAPTEEYVRPGWRSTYAVVAYLAGQYAEARKQLEALDWKLAERNLNGWDVDLSLMPLAVAAHTGPLQRQIQEAENSANLLKVSEAVAKYEALEKDPVPDPRTASYIHYRLATLRMEKQFQDGEWVPLLPTGEDDPTWRVIAGKLHPEKQAFVMEPDQGWHTLLSRLHAGSNFEMQGVMEILQSANGSFQCGMVMGFPMYGSSDWYGVRLRTNARRQGQVSFSKAWSSQEYVQGAVVDSSTNSIHLKLVEGKMDVEINGEPVLQNQAPNPQMKIRPNNFVVGVGADNDGNGTVVRYRDLRIRKVTN